MSVLIKGMEMPKDCYNCCMYEADIYYCVAAERDIDITSSNEGRCSFCPLIELPSHGDIDEAVKYIKSTQEYLIDIGETWYADYLSDAIDLLGQRDV